jgi:ABC-type sugar transport system ATPase subunit
VTTTVNGFDDALAIDLVQVTKRYEEFEAVSSVDLHIDPGEFVALLGPSGCGKSTLLKLICGLEMVSDGEIYLDGALANYMPPKQRDVAMVFQNYALYPHMTVAANIGFPLSVRRDSRHEITSRVEAVAQLVGLSDHLTKYPDQLSGGQRQRVALGRAIIRHPGAFLMDEPLSNLDALLRVHMRTELLKLHRAVGRTTVYVTHDQTEAMTMADKVVVMRDGVTQQIARPEEIYAWPANTFVASFVGAPPMNLLNGTVREGVFCTEGGQRAALGDLAGQYAAMTTAGLRPECLSPVGESAAGSLSGTVDLVETIGPDSYVSVALSGTESVIARVPSPEAPNEGDRVHLGFQPEKLRAFGADGRAIWPPDHPAGRAAPLTQ